MLHALLAAALQTALPQQPIAYTVQLAAASTKVQFEMRLSVLTPPVDLVMPRAIPMAYGTEPYDRFYTDVRAFDADDHALAVTRSEFAPRWRLGDGAAAPVRVCWSIDLGAMEDAIDSGCDASKQRPGYVFLLGYSAFAYIDGLQPRPIRLSVRAPAEWPVFTTLAPQAPPARGGLTVDASDFYALADSQLLAGPALEVRRVHETGRAGPLPDQPATKPRFDAALPPLYVAGHADGAVDWDCIGDRGQLALQAVVDWFGSAPFAHFTLIAECLEPRSPRHRYGIAMEHLDSATFCDTLADVRAAERDAGSAAIALYHYAHHIAHAWLPKRCAMAGYRSFPWEYAPVIDSIWFSEGFGQYIAADALEPLRPGIRDRILAGRFRRLLALTPRSLDALPLPDLSRLASTQYEAPFMLAANCFARGGLMAAAIDAEVRRQTGGKQGLREGLRALVARGGEAPCDVPELVAAVQRATGVDVAAIVARWLAPLAQR